MLQMLMLRNSNLAPFSDNLLYLPLAPEIL